MSGLDASAAVHNSKNRDVLAFDTILTLAGFSPAGFDPDIKPNAVPDAAPRRQQQQLTF